jgi:hypothetical protein
MNKAEISKLIRKISKIDWKVSDVLNGDNWRELEENELNNLMEYCKDQERKLVLYKKFMIKYRISDSKTSEIIEDYTIEEIMDILEINELENKENKEDLLPFDIFMTADSKGNDVLAQIIYNEYGDYIPIIDMRLEGGSL